MIYDCKKVCCWAFHLLAEASSPINPEIKNATKKMPNAKKFHPTSKLASAVNS